MTRQENYGITQDSRTFLDALETKVSIFHPTTFTELETP